jgi:hypothetical protein
MIILSAIANTGGFVCSAIAVKFNKVFAAVFFRGIDAAIRGNLESCFG